MVVLAKPLVAGEKKNAGRKAEKPAELEEAPPVTQQPEGATEDLLNSKKVVERIGGDDGVRTRDLRRDRPAF